MTTTAAEKAPKQPATKNVQKAADSAAADSAPGNTLVRMQTTAYLTKEDVATGLTLMDHADEFAALDALWAMDEGESTPESEELEASLMQSAALKVDRYAAVVRLFTTRAEFTRAEAKRLTERARRFEAKVQRMLDYSLRAMERANAQKLEGATATMSWRYNRWTAKVECEPDTLPFEYVTLIPSSVKPDLNALAKALQDGVEIPGVSLSRTKSVRFS